MKRLSQTDRNESLLYLVIWAVAFLLGAGFVLVQGASSSAGPSWAAVGRFWLRFLPFLVLFLLHNHLAAPLLVHRRQVGPYVLCSLLLLAGFAAAVLLMRTGPGMVQPGPGPADGGFGGPPPGGFGGPGGFEAFGGGASFGGSAGFGGGQPKDGPMPLNPEFLKIILAALMMVANLGIKYQYGAVRNAARVQELEAENLKQRLDTLRYQINPHFFMNTLNNIHALVDLDPEKAKESIVELSRLMRHILYDAGSQVIPLGQELAFLQHYVALMRLRYPEGVDISLQLPEHDGGAKVPPLVFASFVENAFKHGVSYAAPSFIRISLSVDGGKVIFRCRNSRQAAAQDVAVQAGSSAGSAGSSVGAEAAGGIGQENTRRRLDLLYGDRYTLHFDSEEDAYEVLLVLPVQLESAVS